MFACRIHCSLCFRVRQRPSLSLPLLQMPWPWAHSGGYSSGTQHLKSRERVAGEWQLKLSRSESPKTLTMGETGSAGDQGREVSRHVLLELPYGGVEWRWRRSYHLVIDNKEEWLILERIDWGVKEIISEWNQAWTAEWRPETPRVRLEWGRKVRAWVVGIWVAADYVCALVNRCEMEGGEVRDNVRSEGGHGSLREAWSC